MARKKINGKKFFKTIKDKIKQIPKNFLSWIKSLTVEDYLGMLLILLAAMIIFAFIKPFHFLDLYNTYGAFPVPDLYWQSYFHFFIRAAMFKYLYFVMFPLFIYWIVKKIVKNKWKVSGRITVLIIGVAMMLLLFFYAPEITYPKSEQPKIDMFILTFGANSRETIRILEPTIDLLGDKIDLEYHFLIYEDRSQGNSPFCIEDGAICALYGIRELNEDMRQLCILEYEEENWRDYRNCVYGPCSFLDVDTCWETCAAAEGMNKDKIKECVDTVGMALLKADRDLAKRYTISTVPDMRINGYTFIGNSSEHYKQTICSAFKEPPEECQMPVIGGDLFAFANVCGAPQEQDVIDAYTQQ